MKNTNNPDQHRMTKVKVKSLKGISLDWAVDALSSGNPLVAFEKQDGSGEWIWAHNNVPFPGPLNFSSDGKLALELMEAELIDVDSSPGRADHCRSRAVATSKIKDNWGFYNRVSANGPNIITAAMRCYVAMHVGEYIEIPSVIAATVIEADIAQ